MRYDQVNAMLLNEFLKEHQELENQGHEIHEQQATITHLKSTIAQQQKGIEVLKSQLKEQAAQIQKVSAQIEVNKPTAQIVNKDHLEIVGRLCQHRMLSGFAEILSIKTDKLY